jgi:hypothetical protein
VGKLTQDVAALQEELRSKEAIIRRVQSWRDHDTYVMGGGDGREDALEEQRVQGQAVHDQESKEMADAAYQTIKTLREMLEQKKTQVRSKEDQIDRLRQQMAEDRERHAEQYTRLQSEVTATGKSTLASLHAMVSQQEAPTSAGGDRQGQEARRHEDTAKWQKTQRELEHFQAEAKSLSMECEQAREERVHAERRCVAL